MSTNMIFQRFPLKKMKAVQPNLYIEGILNFAWICLVASNTWQSELKQYITHTIYRYDFWFDLLVQPN